MGSRIGVVRGCATTDLLKAFVGQLLRIKLVAGGLAWDRHGGVLELKTAWPSQLKRTTVTGEFEDRCIKQKQENFASANERTVKTLADGGFGFRY